MRQPTVALTGRPSLMCCASMGSRGARMIHKANSASVLQFPEHAPPAIGG